MAIPTCRSAARSTASVRRVLQPEHRRDLELHHARGADARCDQHHRRRRAGQHRQLPHGAGSARRDRLLTGATSVTINVAAGTYNELVHYTGPGGHAADGDHSSGPASNNHGDNCIQQYANGNGMNGSTQTRPTSSTAGANLVLQNITLKNTALRSALSQAEALYFASGTGFTVAAGNSSFLSKQDTIQTSGRSWFYNCHIEGNVDFIWGTGDVALFESCSLRFVNDIAGQGGELQLFVARTGTTIAAAASGTVGKGYVLLNSTVAVDANVTVSFGRDAGTGAFYDQVALVNVMFTAGHGALAAGLWNITTAPLSLGDSSYVGWKSAGCTGLTGGDDHHRRGDLGDHQQPGLRVRHARPHPEPRGHRHHGRAQRLPARDHHHQLGPRRPRHRLWRAAINSRRLQRSRNSALERRLDCAQRWAQHLSRRWGSRFGTTPASMSAPGCWRRTSRWSAERRLRLQPPARGEAPYRSRARGERPRMAGLRGQRAAHRAQRWRGPGAGPHRLAEVRRPGPALLRLGPLHSLRLAGRHLAQHRRPAGQDRRRRRLSHRGAIGRQRRPDLVVRQTDYLLPPHNWVPSYNLSR